MNSSTPQVMVLLPTGRRHAIPRAATNRDCSVEVASPASPLPAISVRTMLPLARLVQQLGAWPRRKAMQSKQPRPATQRSSVSPVQQTLWYRLPPNSQHQLAHLVADLIQRIRRAAQDKEQDHEC